MTEALHIPVLLNEVVAGIAPKDGGVYIDGTFGAGGYASAVLNAADCKVFGIDRDPFAIENGRKLVERFNGRLTLIHGVFGDMKNLTASYGVEKVDGVMLDIGVSSMQIDTPERGFSFQKNGALDMRMSRTGLSAADVVNTFEEHALADLIYAYGEERFSRRIAKSIVEKRKEKPFETTLELASVVRAAMPEKRKEGIDAATRTFQALRIYVNDELEQLRSGLNEAEELLKKGGRMAVVSFHSLEDRIVKTFMQEKSGKQTGVSRYAPQTRPPAATLRLLTKKPILPSEKECARNPRCRSSRLRLAEAI